MVVDVVLKTSNDAPPDDVVTNDGDVEVQPTVPEPVVVYDVPSDEPL